MSKLECFCKVTVFSTTEDNFTTYLSFFLAEQQQNVLEILRQMVGENYIFKKRNQREFKNLCATKSEL